MGLADLRSVLGPTMRVLDLGCGPGWPALPLASHVGEVAAVDASDLALTLIRRAIQARKVPNVRVEYADAMDLPFEENTFDAVIAGELMDVVADPKQVAREMFRVLKVGGGLVSWIQNFRYVLGRSETCSRSFERGERKAFYTYHRATLSPAQSLDLRFQVERGSSSVPWAEVPTGTREADPEGVLAELQQLHPALHPQVERYRAREFTPETAMEPFAAAGFAGLEVIPLNHDAGCDFAQELGARKVGPREAEEFHAFASE